MTMNTYKWIGEAYHGFVWSYGNEMRGPWVEIPDPPRLYGVSSGNGNNGVSHIWPNYYVTTDDPWTLTKAAMLAEFKPGKGQQFALDAMEIDGEADYTIYATIYDPPNENESENDEDEESDEDSEPAECESWSNFNGAWLIVEVFPEDEPRSGTIRYASLSEAFSPDLLALATAD